MQEVIITLDQGTSSCRTLLINRKQEVVVSSQKPLPLHTPQPGWVEQDAETLFQLQMETIYECLKRCPRKTLIAGISITNQRETVVAWDVATGEPLAPAIVWQDRRTTDLCLSLKAHEKKIFAKTGLPVDPYFSASKMSWLLRKNTKVQMAQSRGTLRFGTIDSWLVFRLTQGERHVTDPTNACRTQLFNLKTGDWDEDLLEMFDIPPETLPYILPNDIIRGISRLPHLETVPILSSMGDQQAALFGHRALHPRMGKCTFGTGAFALSYLGTELDIEESKFLQSVAFTVLNQMHFCREGSLLVAGSAVQFLRDNLQMIASVQESETLAKEVQDAGDLVFVPALAGLGTPHWDPNARGLFIGMDRGTTKEHFVRATLEGIALQAYELVESLNLHQRVLIDGGLSENNFFCEMLSGLLDREIYRAVEKETTAMGAFGMGGLVLGWWDLNQWKREPGVYQKIHHTLPPERKKDLLKRWSKAVNRCKNWA